LLTSPARRGRRPRPGRAGRVIRLFAAFTILASGALVGTASSVVDAPPASAAFARTFGGAPLDNVMFWAGHWAAQRNGERPGCNLSANRLAAMMLTPTFTETGAPTGQAPSPMTLSRWDTQDALWAFGNKATPYQGAFFHPGVGMWQFDSAGGWNLNGAQAIDAVTSASQAAATMSSGYCNNPSTDPLAKMRSGWAPWYYCASTTQTICPDLLNTIFDGTNLLVGRDNSVSATGGMAYRTCYVAGIGNVFCAYVDPSRAQGYTGWNRPPVNGVPPTPIAKPFYVFTANGREYRAWFKGDTGYAIGIMASKPVTANVRTSIVWQVMDANSSMCDLTTGAGDCGAVPGPASGFHSVVPARVLDPRYGIGTAGSYWRPEERRNIKLTGVGGVPATGVSSVLLNVTVTAPTQASFLSVFPAGAVQAPASSLNWEPGQTVSNLVSARVDASGYASFYNRAGNVTVIADVVGYYDDGSAASPSLVTGVTPSRVLDSRNGTGGYGSPWTPHSVRSVLVRGVGGVPADADTAFVNLTATNVTGYSFLAVAPTGVPVPDVSNLSLAPGDTRSVLVASRIGPDGRINILNWEGNTDVIADVVGFARTAGGNRFHAMAPVRALDTRSAGFELVGPWGAFQTRNLTLGGRFGVPSGATAVAVNVTVASATLPTFVRMFPAGAATGDTSTVNLNPGQIVANMAMVKLGTAGLVSIYNLQGNTDLVIDVVGWYD
jgi:hypothetical protein